MKTCVYWILSLLASAGIGALFIFLFISLYFPAVSMTLWIAVAVSILMLVAFVSKLFFVNRENSLSVNKRIRFYWLWTIIGAVATISFSMMALSGYLVPASTSALVLIFLSAMFFAFEMIQLVIYAYYKLR